MAQPLVSVLTPCYNGEGHLFRLFESILAQTHQNIEFIFVNDGSTDGTEAAALAWAPRFEQRGIRFIYEKQANAGAAAALNAALKLFTGDYLMTIDADDWLAPACLERRVAFLEAHPEYGFMRSNVLQVEEEDLMAPAGREKWPPRALATEHKRRHTSLYREFLLMDTYVLGPYYLIRAEVFLRANPGRELWVERSGQNIQFFCPVSWHAKCGWLEEPLAYYQVRAASHSHSGADTLEAGEEKIAAERRILKWCVDITSKNEEDYALARACGQRETLALAARHGRRDEAAEAYAALKAAGLLRAKEWFTWHAMAHPWLGLYFTIRQLARSARQRLFYILHPVKERYVPHR